MRHRDAMTQMEGVSRTFTYMSWRAPLNESKVTCTSAAIFALTFVSCGSFRIFSASLQSFVHLSFGSWCSKFSRNLRKTISAFFPRTSWPTVFFESKRMITLMSRRCDRLDLAFSSCSNGFLNCSRPFDSSVSSRIIDLMVSTSSPVIKQRRASTTHAARPPSTWLLR